MCGIAGWVKKDIDVNFASFVLSKASERGCDGYGLLDLESHRVLKNARRFINHISIRDFENKAILAHFRLHTIIDTSNDLNYLQPLKYKNFYIAHNGFLKNIKSESDSLYLLKKIIKNFEDITMVQDELEIEKIAVAIYNTETEVVSLYRDKMPLYLFKGVFCSKKINSDFEIIPEKKRLDLKYAD